MISNIKNRIKKSPLILLGGLGLSLSLGACAGSDAKISHTEQCKIDFDEAKTEVADESNTRAIELLNNILNNCSGTGFMEDAQYMLGEVYFAEEEWLDARAEFSLFATHFSTSPKAPMAAYLAALSAYKSPFKEGRDAAITDQAIRDFSDFIDSYPESPKLDSAKIYNNELIERKARRDYNIAYLYLRMSEPLAAAIYLKHFIVDFPNSENYFNAHLKLVESYSRLDQYDQARIYLDKILYEVPAEKDKYAYLYKEIEDSEKEYNARIAEEQEEKRIKAEKEL